MIKLFADELCWQFREEHPEEWKTFGCGPGWLGDLLVPDKIYGISVKEACRIHDWYTRFWDAKPSESDRAMIDRIFKWNMLRIIAPKVKDEELLLKCLKRVQLYYWAVRTFGGPSYWEERNPATQYKTVEVK